MASQPAEVFTSKGQVLGEVCYWNDFSINHKLKVVKYFSFKFIPYAHIPVDQLRFAPPKEIKEHEFSDVYTKCNELGNSGENYLFLNIYTPQLKYNQTEETHLKPVIVFVPDDLFYSKGNLDDYGPQFLICQDVVVVTVSIRVGILAFLKFNDPRANAPGNVNLHDLKKAFAWIRSEIENFGGDSTNITAYGHGYGATCIRYLLLSPCFNKDFDKAILSSCKEYLISRKFPEKGGFYGPVIAEEFGFMGPWENDLACVEYLRHLELQDLLYCGDIITELYSDETIHRYDLRNIIQQKYHEKIPVLIGYNSQEGLINFDYLQEEFTNTIFNQLMAKQMDTTGKDYSLHHMMDIVFHFCEPNKYALSDYSNFNMLSARPELASDLMYLIGIMTIARNLALEMTPEKVYLYRYSVDFKGYFSKENALGATHGSELAYIFKSPNVLCLEEDSVEHIIVKRMTSIWASFARTGNPNSPEAFHQGLDKWEPIQGSLSHCFDISQNETKFCEIPETERMKFWENWFSLNFFSGPKNIENEVAEEYEIKYM